MMIDQHIIDTLSPLVGGRVFPDVAPSGTERPYIVYQQIGGEPLNFVDRTVPDKKRSVIQVGSWANSRLEASPLGDSIEMALRTASGPKADVETGITARHDETTGYRGTMQDFSFFA